MVCEVKSNGNEGAEPRCCRASTMWIATSSESGAEEAHKTLSWQCPNCGNYIDEVIIANRASTARPESVATVSPAEKKNGLPNRWR